MENNKNKKSVKFQRDMLNFYDFIQVFVFTTNHHHNHNDKYIATSPCGVDGVTTVKINLLEHRKWNT